VVSVARGWSSSNTTLYRRAAQQRERYLLVRYEELAATPEPVLRRCCDLLEIEFQPAMLDCTNRHPRYRNMDHHQRLYEPISTARVGVYAGQLTPQEVRTCARFAREGLTLFGYRSPGVWADIARRAERALPTLRAWLRQRADSGHEAAPKAA